MLINLFCLLFMEFTSFNVRRLCFLRKFHTVLPCDCSSLHALQACRSFPDLQVPSVFMILLVGFLLIVILSRGDPCSFVLTFLLFSHGEYLPFATCPWKRASCPAQPQQLWGTGLVSPQHVEHSWTRMKPLSPAVSDGFSTTG